MHFGEYELSPSLISLSPLPSAHPEAFQRLLVRSSSWCYPTFNLTKGRSLGFASATADYTPSSDSLSLRIRVSSHLTLPAKATRRFIMQKARRHCFKQLRPLVGARFQELFHSSVRSAFHLSLTVLVRYRSLFIPALCITFRMSSVFQSLSFVHWTQLHVYSQKLYLIFSLAFSAYPYTRPYTLYSPCIILYVNFDLLIFAVPRKPFGTRFCDPALS